MSSHSSTVISSGKIKNQGIAGNMRPAAMHAMHGLYSSAHDGGRLHQTHNVAHKQCVAQTIQGRQGQAPCPNKAIVLAVK